jgi:23S rRNA (uracil1939-C5)-methyltransferase
MFTIGRATEILEASSDRVKPVCPYYGECGGCQYQHLSYEKEVHYKAEQVRELLSRIGGFKEYAFDNITPSSSQYGYRSSITLHRSEKSYGYFAMDNKTIIAIERCPLAADAINDAISTLPSSGGKRDVTIKCDSKGNALISGYPGHRFFKDNLLNTELTFSPLAFSQANKQVASAVVEKLRMWMKEEKREVLFDVYCGVGFFGILLNDLFKLIIGIDDSRIAISCAQASKKDLAIENIRFYYGEADDKFPGYYGKLHGKVNTLLLDPPRSGISEGLLMNIAGLRDLNSIYYISCDPAILARDAKNLTKDEIWKLDSLACFDMFPRTKHVESIAVFRR